MEVTPDKQNIDTLFSNTNFHIDFYQREYKWTEYEVTRLLEDVFYHFDQIYAEHRDLDPSQENVSREYRWYYLNTYITNRAEGKVFVVDGQQRLTTLTLVLIALHRMCRTPTYQSDEMADWLKAKILGVGVGGKKQFWMAHEKRQPLMQALLAGKEASESMIEDGITAHNIIANFEVIAKHLTKSLPERHKLETFVYYFLGQVVIINHDPTEVYVSGYKEAGDSFVNLVADRKGTADTLFFPVVFLYRHYIELGLKSLLHDGNRLLDQVLTGRTLLILSLDESI
jgi:hypothetical protein